MDSKTVKFGACILAADMDTMVPFYRDILGLETDWNGGDFAELFTASGRLSFWIYSRAEFDKVLNLEYQPPKGINQTCELAFWLPDYAAVDAEYERLKAMGNVSFPCGEPITFPFGIRNFYVADPEGNLIEIGSENKE